MNIGFPLRIDARGRTATVDHEQHIRDLIQQVLFTEPGERVNRPNFGAGLAELVFTPNNSELATATTALVSGALQQELGALIIVEAVRVNSTDSTVQITVQYMVRHLNERQVAQFEREL